MNNLKFRIWDNQNKKWQKNDWSFHCFSNWSICPFTGCLTDFVGIMDGDHETLYTASPAAKYYVLNGQIKKEPRYVVQQYIGLKDKNEKECFDGDLISFRPKSNKPPFYQVKYDSDRACFLPYNVKHKCFLEDDEDFPVFLYSNEFRIVGNIFENPELI